MIFIVCFEFLCN